MPTFVGKPAAGSAASNALEIAQSIMQAPARTIDEATDAMLRSAGYTDYDVQTGCYTNPTTHFMYNSSTAQYYDCRAEVYYTYDETTSQYKPVPVVKQKRTAELAPAVSLPMTGYVDETKKKRKNIEPVDVMKPLPIAPLAPEPAHVPPPATEPTPTPEIKHICNICMRGFKDEVTLDKHIQYSQLHKDNIIKLSYRDRAADRRAEEGPAVMSELPQTHHVTNIGQDMMKAMGWHGEGLGSKEQGIAVPISLDSTQTDTAGLGSRAMGINPTDDRRTRNYKMTVNRYKETFAE